MFVLAIQNMAADKDLKNASISFYAYDLDSNKIVAGLGANKSFGSGINNEINYNSYST